MNQELNTALAKLMEGEPYRITLSKPDAGSEYKKINLLRREAAYQAECYTEKQVFHYSYAISELEVQLGSWLTDSYGQLNGWSKTHEYQIMRSKKGKISCVRRAVKGAQAPKEQSTNNRKKNYLLPEGEVIAPLVDMGIFTKEGRVAKQMYNKYRQINRFLEIIEDSLKTYRMPEDRPLKIVDFGCGKSYLTFVVYYYLTEVRKLSVKMIGLDLKEDVIALCNKAAEKYGYTGLTFLVGDVGAYKDDVPADMIITLHACDTATDYALYHAVSWNAGMIFSVPCCQHELNAQVKCDAMPILGRYGIVQERAMALMTDAIRCNLLECCGYRTNLMEFVDFENTPKNLLIRAVKTRSSIPKLRPGTQVDPREKYYREVKQLTETFALDQTLLRLLTENGYLEGLV